MKVSISSLYWPWCFNVCVIPNNGSCFALALNSFRMIFAYEQKCVHQIWCNHSIEWFAEMPAFITPDSISCSLCPKSKPKIWFYASKLPSKFNFAIIWRYLIEEEICISFGYQLTACETLKQQRRVNKQIFWRTVWVATVRNVLHSFNHLHADELCHSDEKQACFCQFQMLFLHFWDHHLSPLNEHK